MYGLSALVLLAVYYRWTRRKAIAALAKMNGPPKLPLLGHVFLIKYTSQGAIFFVNYDDNIMVFNETSDTSELEPI